MAEWHDWDGAAYELAVSLGVLDPGMTYQASKWLFWTDNLVGNALHQMLLALVEAGALESNEDDQFRWDAATLRQRLTD
jgi:hypothetical protein